MLQVNLEDVKAHYEQRKLWNKTPLKDMQFLYKGEGVKELPHYDNNGNIEPLTIDEWVYTGLANIDYLYMMLEANDPSFNEVSSLSIETTL